MNIFGKTDNIRQDLVMYTFFSGFSVFLFSIIGLGRNETIGEEQEKRWGNEENEKERTRKVIETNEGVHKENRGKEEKSHVDSRVAVRVYRFPRYIQSDLFMDLVPVDQDSRL